MELTDLLAPELMVLQSNTTNDQPRLDRFHQEAYRTSVISILVVCLICIAVECFFISVVRHCAGIRSNFSFTVMIGIALCGLQQHLATLAACILALREQYLRNYDINRLIGNLQGIPFFTIILLNFVLTVHRMICTLNPANYTLLAPPIACKSSMAIIALLHFGLLLFFQFFNYASFTWSPLFLNYGVSLHTSNTTLLYVANTLCNMVVGIINISVWPYLCVVVAQRCKCRRITMEFRMNAIFCLSALVEVVYAAYCLWPRSTDLSPAAVVVSTIVNISYIACIPIPYLCFSSVISNQLRSPRRIRPPPVEGEALEAVLRARATKSRFAARPVRPSQNEEEAFLVEVANI